MTILEAFSILEHRTPEERDSLLPGEFYLNTPGGRVDVWAFAAAAAVSLTGWLPTIDTRSPEAENDVSDAVRQFETLLTDPHFDVSQEQWEAETRAVLGEVCRAGGDMERHLLEAAGNTV